MAKRQPLHEIVRGEDQTLAALRKLLEVTRNDGAGLGIQAREGLVQKQQVRVVDEGPREGETLLHPPGVVPNKVILPAGQPQLPQELAAAISRGGHGIHPGVKEKVFRGGQAAIEHQLMQENADPPAEDDPEGPRSDVHSAQEGLPPRGPEKGGEDAQERGLAGPVGTEEDEDLPGTDREPDMTEGRPGSENPSQTPRLDQRGGAQRRGLATGPPRGRGFRSDSRRSSRVSICLTTSAASA